METDSFWIKCSTAGTASRREFTDKDPLPTRMSESAKLLNKQLLKALKEIPKDQSAVKTDMEALLRMLGNIPAFIQEEIVPITVAAAVAQTQPLLEEQTLRILVNRTRTRDARIEAEQTKMHEATRKAIEEAVGVRMQEWWIKNCDMVMETKDYVDQQLGTQQNILNHVIKQTAMAQINIQSRMDDID